MHFLIPNNVKYLTFNAFVNVELSKGCVWLDKNGVEISTPIVGARVVRKV